MDDDLGGPPGPWLGLADPDDDGDADADPDATDVWVPGDDATDPNVDLGGSD